MNLKGVLLVMIFSSTSPEPKTSSRANLKTIKFDTFVDWVFLFNLTESKVLNKV